MENVEQPSAFGESLKVLTDDFHEYKPPNSSREQSRVTCGRLQQLWPITHTLPPDSVRAVGGVVEQSNSRRVRIPWQRERVQFRNTYDHSS